MRIVILRVKIKAFCVLYSVHSKMILLLYGDEKDVLTSLRVKKV